MKKGVIEIKPVSLPHVKSILSERKKEGELTFEQKVSLDYSKEFGKGKEKNVDKAVEEMLQFGLDPSTAVKIINAMPESKEELRLILEKVRFDIKEDQMSKIIDLIKTL